MRWGHLKRLIGYVDDAPAPADPVLCPECHVPEGARHLLGCETGVRAADVLRKRLLDYYLAQQAAIDAARPRHVIDECELCCRRCGLGVDTIRFYKLWFCELQPVEIDVSADLYQRCSICNGTRTIPAGAVLVDAGAAARPGGPCLCNRSPTPGWCKVGLTMGQVERMQKVAKETVDWLERVLLNTAPDTMIVVQPSSLRDASTALQRAFGITPTVGGSQ